MINYYLRDLSAAEFEISQKSMQNNHYDIKIRYIQFINNDCETNERNIRFRNFSSYFLGFTYFY